MSLKLVRDKMYCYKNNHRSSHMALSGAMKEHLGDFQEIEDAAAIATFTQISSRRPCWLP